MSGLRKVLIKGNCDNPAKLSLVNLAYVVFVAPLDDDSGCHIQIAAGGSAIYSLETPWSLDVVEQEFA